MIAGLRDQHHRAHVRLNRARRLYRFLVRRELLFGGDEALIRIVVRMKSTGLYAASTNREDVASILVRTVYRLYHGRGLGYHHWNRWRAGHFPDWTSKNRFFCKRLREAV